MTLRLHNSLTGRLEEFAPLVQGKVRMYNCGPTVYRRNHLGNYRAYAMADLIRRSLEYLGFDVLQIMNITDVGHLTEDDVADAQGEDKLLKEASRRNVDPWQIAREVEDWFHEDRRKLRIRDAHHYPRATEHIAEMIEMIAGLIEKGHAYVAAGNVYFDVRTFERYGRLSGNTLEQLEEGASGRVDERTDKRHPEDFALWKHDPKHLMQWESPWGRGFPGWHIECSAMARKYLGDTFDIHTGGPDNKFPHHECEIAQSESYNEKPFVRHWMHCGWLEIGGGKMAKRAGKTYTIPELEELGFSGADVRFYLLKSHYRAPIPFDLDLLAEARTVRARINHFFHFQLAERPEGFANAEITAAVEEAQARFRTALEDDLNVSEALAALHELMTTVNRLEPSRADADVVRDFVREVDGVLDMLDGAPERGDDDAEIDALVAERDRARDEKNWGRADEIRDDLKARGVELLDSAQGTRWKRS